MNEAAGASLRSVAVAGGTGLVGGHLIAQLVADPGVRAVAAVGRRPPALRAEKLQAHTVDLLADDAASRIEAVLPTLDVGFCALGTTIKAAGSNDAFLRVDQHAVLAFARACRARGASTFVVVSALGASPRSINFYLHTKGRVEEELATLGFTTLHLARPGILDGERTEKRPLERLGLMAMRGVARVLSPQWAYAPIHGATVARAMLRLARDPTPGTHVHASAELVSIGRA